MAEVGLLALAKAYAEKYADKLFSKHKDYIVESGTYHIWTYEKWNSGKARCWGRHTGSVSGTFTEDDAWGSLYRTTLNDRIDYPFKFIKEPIETVTLRSNYSMILSNTYKYSYNTTSQTACYDGVRPSTLAADFEYALDFDVVGRWK